MSIIVAHILQLILFCFIEFEKFVNKNCDFYKWAVTFDRYCTIPTCNLSENQQLTTISFPKLSSIQIRLYIHGNPQLTSLNLGKLSRVPRFAHFELSSNPMLGSISFPELTSVGNYHQEQHCYDLYLSAQTFRLPRLFDDC